MVLSRVSGLELAQWIFSSIYGSWILATTFKIVVLALLLGYVYRMGKNHGKKASQHSERIKTKNQKIDKISKKLRFLKIIIRRTQQMHRRFIRLTLLLGSIEFMRVFWLRNRYKLPKLPEMVISYQNVCYELMEIGVDIYTTLEPALHTLLAATTLSFCVERFTKWCSSELQTNLNTVLKKRSVIIKKLLKDLGPEISKSLKTFYLEDYEKTVKMLKRELKGLKSDLHIGNKTLNAQKKKLEIFKNFYKELSTFRWCGKCFIETGGACSEAHHKHEPEIHHHRHHHRQDTEENEEDEDVDTPHKNKTVQFLEVPTIAEIEEKGPILSTARSLEDIGSTTARSSRNERYVRRVVDMGSKITSILNNKKLHMEELKNSIRAISHTLSLLTTQRYKRSKAKAVSRIRCTQNCKGKFFDFYEKLSQKFKQDIQNATED